MLDQFKRVDFGDMALLAGAVSIILLLAIFVTISIRCFILPKAALDTLAALPLDDPQPAEPAASTNPSTPSPNQP